MIDLVRIVHASSIGLYLFFALFAWARCRKQANPVLMDLALLCGGSALYSAASVLFCFGPWSGMALERCLFLLMFSGALTYYFYFRLISRFFLKYQRPFKIIQGAFLFNLLLVIFGVGSYVLVMHRPLLFAPTSEPLEMGWVMSLAAPGYQPTTLGVLIMAVIGAVILVSNLFLLVKLRRELRYEPLILFGIFWTLIANFNDILLGNGVLNLIPLVPFAYLPEIVRLVNFAFSSSSGGPQQVEGGLLQDEINIELRRRFTHDLGSLVGSVGAPADSSQRQLVERVNRLFHLHFKYSRESRGNIRRRVAVAEQIMVAIELLRLRLMQSEISVEIKVDSKFLVDEVEGTIALIAYNLIANAADAVEHLKRSQRTIVISGAVKDLDFLELQFENGGPCLGPELAGRLFETGFSTRGTDRGWGLKIVRNLALENGALIFFEPSAERNCFKLLWPYGQSR